MSKTIFTWGKDGEGRTGWVMNSMPHFDVTVPENIAHDCMEHFPGGMKHGVIADEMLALGARLWLRVASEYWSNQPDYGEPEETWSNEMARQLEFIFMNKVPEPLAPRTVPALTGTLEELEDIIRFSEWDGVEGFNEVYWNAYNVEDYLSRGDPVVKIMADWMRVGVVAAQKRYNGCNEYMVWRGDTLDKEVAKLKYMEEGNELIVTVHESNLEVEAVLRRYDYTIPIL